jgi:hypothetical protein
MFGGELSSRTILPSYSLQIQLFLTMSMRGRPEEELIAMWILYPNTYLSHKYDSTLTKRLYLCSCDVYICSCCASVSLHVYNRKTMLLWMIEQPKEIFPPLITFIHRSSITIMEKISTIMCRTNL